jgi:hypothetical protein
VARCGDDIARIRRLPIASQAPSPTGKTETPPRSGSAVKTDPKYVAAARELRDRWLEQVNAGRYLPATAAKYEVSRTSTSPVESLDESTSVSARDHIQPAG